ncbi:hypothetical protein [Halosegnis longus]|uniref:Uncharacterized protein n=1 Tax=Halosegnis longus TaxID=2216012 RepID=A0AAJ4UV28_9EURY|nr:hypothetical protein Nmn1133_01405 [Salella cibi]
MGDRDTETDERVEDYWRAVALRFSNDQGNIQETNFHSHAAEMTALRDDILEGIDELEHHPSSLREDDMFDESDFEQLPDFGIIPRELSHKLVALFSISCGIIDNQLRLLLERDVVDQSVANEGTVENYFDNTSLKPRLTLVHISGIIDEGLYGQADDVRKTRNDLVHDPLDRLSIRSTVALEDRVRKAVRVPDDLSELLQE